MERLLHVEGVLACEIRVVGEVLWVEVV